MEVQFLVPCGAVQPPRVGGDWHNHRVMARRRDRSSSRPQDPGEWKIIAPTVVFTTVFGTVCLLLGLVVLPLILLVGAVPLAFMTGYLYRASVTASGRTPPFRFLRVKGEP